MAVGSSHLYWTGPQTRDSIVEANVDGTGQHTIATGQNTPLGVAVNSSHLYWANNLGGTIIRANLDSTEAAIIARRQDGPFGVAVGP